MRILLGAKYARGRLLDALPARSRDHRATPLRSVRRPRQRRPVETVADVNDPAFVDRVRDLDPDVLLSIVCGQRIGPSLRAVPDYAIDLHGSLLPKYWGRATAFWPLYYGDDGAGVAAHLPTDEWDAGPILDQRSFPLAPEDTVNDVYRRIAEAGPTLALDVLDAVEAGSVETRPNPTTDEDYHTLPTRAERRAFRRRETGSSETDADPRPRWLVRVLSRSNRILRPPAIMTGWGRRRFFPATSAVIGLGVARYMCRRGP